MVPDETPAQYAEHLMSMIESSQSMIATLQRQSFRYPVLADEYAELIAKEKQLITTFERKLQELF